MLTCCLGQAGIVKADDTDISSNANVVYIQHFEVQPGATNFFMYINMKNAAAICGFQFDLELPEGITLFMSGTSIYRRLNDDRCPIDPGTDAKYHTLDVSQQTDGSYRFLAGSLAVVPFNGNDGAMITVKINVAPGMETGDYPIRLKNIKLNESDPNTYYTTELVESTVTVSNTPRTILNETATTAPAAAASANVRVNRYIKANEWSSICLPFDMTAEQVTAAFGNDVLLADFTGYDVTKDGDDVTGITVNFANATTITKNHPYLIKVASTVSSFVADGVDVVIGTPTYTPATGKSFVGTYVAETTVPNNGLFLYNNKFYYSTGKTKMKAFRAYFNFADVLADKSVAGAPILMSFDGEGTTSLSEEIRVNSEEFASGNEYYTLDGRLVKTPTKGVYIHNGKKVVIK